MKIWSRIRQKAKSPEFILFLFIIYFSIVVTKVYIKPPPEPINNTTDKITIEWRR